MAVTDQHLVDVSNFGIKSRNYYWENRRRLGMTERELFEIGIRGNSVCISEALIKPLKRANRKLKPLGYELLIKDGYRSSKLYKLAYERRKQYLPGSETILNMESRPHESGRVVDVVLAHLSNGREITLRNKNDGHDSLRINFYKDKNDSRSKLYQERQLLLRQAMESAGFKLGLKKEYWHFELAN